MKQTTIALLFILLSLDSLAQSTARVVVEEITPDAAQRSIALTGTTQAAQHAEISSLVEGIVVTLAADTGDVVEKGQPLLELDTELAKAQLQSLQASVTQQEVLQREARRRLLEAQTLSERQFVAQSEIAQRQALVAEAEANLARTQADYQYQQVLLNQHTLTAPFSGVIAQRNVDLGEWLSRGEFAFELISNQQLWLDVAVPQEYFGLIDNSDPVKVHLDAHPDRVYNATMIAKLPVIDSENRSFLLRLELEDATNIQSGLSARVSIPLNSEYDSVVMIPSDALLRQPDGRYSVFVIDQGQALRQSVEIGQRVNGHIEILEGLQVGQSVVIEGNELLQEGQKVTIISNTSGAN